jgi:hypothetical protein
LPGSRQQRCIAALGLLAQVIVSKYCDHQPRALGKKNWLFFGDADAGERSAIIYSIIESCQRHDIESYTYLPMC